MISDIFKKIGLDKKETEIYMTLLQTGPVRASTLAYRLRLPRTTAHNILMRLEREGLVTKSIKKNVFVFASIHPTNLPAIMEMKKRQMVSDLNVSIEEARRIAPELAGLMKDIQRLPNVRFYQGREAVRTVLFDTLNSTTELKDFANIDAMFEHVQDINDEYVAEREKTKVTKRSLLLDTPFAREVYESGKYSPKSHKGYKWLNANLYPFALEMNIYDNKVSYITYAENDFVGVIIENEHIYRLHNSMWNVIWDLLPNPKKNKVRKIQST